MPPPTAFAHAWVLPHEIDEERWALLRADAIGVLRAASARLEAGRPQEMPGILRGPDGMGLPDVTRDRIALNGSAFRGEAGEPFILERRARRGVVVRATDGSSGRAIRRCDTGGNPYDLAVCALLLVTELRLGELMRLGSSGGMRDGWREAVRLVREVVPTERELQQSEHGVLRWVSPPGRHVALHSRSSA